MPDPMDALRQPPTPVAPRPAFTAELRRRLEDELGPMPPAPTGGSMSDTATLPTRVQTVTPYLCARDAAAAIRFYKDVFGAREVSEIFIGPDGRVGHAELQIGASVFMIADEYPEEGVLSPLTIGGTSVQLRLQVDDADAVFDRAVGAGAEVLRPVSQQFYGERAGKVRDPFGHNWFIATPVETVTRDEMVRRAGATGFSLTDRVEASDEPPSGDVANLGYFTIRLPDVEQARAFYAELFGWQFQAGSQPDGLHISNTEPPGGLLGGEGYPHLSAYFRVPDITAAVASVRRLGGAANEPAAYASGWLAECHDGQGVAFDLWQPIGDY